MKSAVEGTADAAGTAIQNVGVDDRCVWTVSSAPGESSGQTTMSGTDTPEEPIIGLSKSAVQLPSRRNTQRKSTCRRRPRPAARNPTNARTSQTRRHASRPKAGSGQSLALSSACAQLKFSIRLSELGFLPLATKEKSQRREPCFQVQVDKALSNRRC